VTTSGGLRASVERFGERFNADEQLRRMNADWDRVIDVLATDAEEAVRIELRAGQMRIVEDWEGGADIVLTAPVQVLCDIFSGASSPTEPYLDGRLQVRGSQQDMLRLDLVTLLIWGEE
jgi:putative sterol carrier protein